MKRALIAIASAGFLASTAWVVAANAQANVKIRPGRTEGGQHLMNGTAVPAR